MVASEGWGKQLIAKGDGNLGDNEFNGYSILYYIHLSKLLEFYTKKGECCYLHISVLSVFHFLKKIIAFEEKRVGAGGLKMKRQDIGISLERAECDVNLTLLLRKRWGMCLLTSSPMRASQNRHWNTGRVGCMLLVARTQGLES